MGLAFSQRYCVAWYDEVAQDQWTEAGGVLLSGYLSKEWQMLREMEDRVREAFKSMGPKNPLNRLGAIEKRILWSLATIYAAEGQLDLEKRRPDQIDKLEKTVADASSLAKKLQQQIFDGDLASLLRPFVKDFQDLPSRLGALALRLRSVLDITAGKPGQTRKVMRNRCLLVASEFVRLKTGTYGDEHLADLLQAVSLVPDPKADFSGTDFSGDAIRKKRGYLSSKYPLLCAAAVKEARKCSSVIEESELRDIFWGAMQEAFQGTMVKSDKARSKTQAKGSARLD